MAAAADPAVAVDINNKEMLRRAEARRSKYVGNPNLLEADAMNLAFAANAIDTVATSCIICSVPDPIRGLKELFRVLRPGGRLLMFEHVRSRTPILGVTQDLMTLWTRRLGTEMNRDTVGNTLHAGFRITRIESVFLDIILAIRGCKPERR
jgi:ubiquinone/menaquinone biosynthesis C-methylase UbiE